MHASLTEFHMEDAAIDRFGLAALRDYLLPRLLSGRVRVQAAECRSST